MKEKIKKEYLRRMRKILDTMLLVRYMEPFLKWTREEHGWLDNRQENW